MKNTILAALMVGVLAGCAISRVTFEQGASAQTTDGRMVKAEQSLCEIENQLALFVDENKNLWLNCPYRYEGKVVQSVALIGPGNPPGDSDFAYNSAVEKMKKMQRVPLQSCGKGRYCANLNQYGYANFSVQQSGSRGYVSYLDMSASLIEVEKFYEALNGISQEATLSPKLAKLIDPQKVSLKINRLSSNEQVANVISQLKSAGASDQPIIKESLDKKISELKVIDFRNRKDFEGFYSAFKISESRSDIESMTPLAKTKDQKSQLFGALMQNYGKSKNIESLQLATKFVTEDKERKQLDDVWRMLDQELFESAKVEAYRSKSTDPLNHYLKTSKKLAFKSEANSLITEIGQFKAALDSGSEDKISAFAKKYPNSPLVKEMSGKLNKIEMAKKMKPMLNKEIKWVGSYQQDTDDCVSLFMLKKCMWVTYKFNFTGTVTGMDVDTGVYKVKVHHLKLATPGAVSIKYLQFQSKGVTAAGEKYIDRVTDVAYGDVK